MRELSIKLIYPNYQSLGVSYLSFVKVEARFPVVKVKLPKALIFINSCGIKNERFSKKQSIMYVCFYDEKCPRKSAPKIT